MSAAVTTRYWYLNLGAARRSVSVSKAERPQPTGVNALGQGHERQTYHLHGGVSKSVLFRWEPFCREGELKARREHQQDAELGHGMARTVTVSFDSIDNDLVVNMENHMATRPLLAPAERCLNNSVQLFELNVALSEAPRDATGVPKVAEDTAYPLAL